MKRIASLLLAAILLPTLLASCADNIQPAVDTTAAATQPSDLPEETTSVETSVDEVLGFVKEDNGKKTITILTNSATSYEFNTESENGDIVNDAVFKKDSMVEEYLGVDINLILESGVYKTRKEFNEKVTNDWASGDATYDLINNVLTVTLPLSQQGVFVNVNDLQYTHLEQPWYISEMTENYGIKGKLYGILSDHSLSLYKDLSVVYFNVNLFQEQKSDVDMYDIVRSGDWTLDKFLELTSDMASDLNGDGQYDADFDRFAYFGEAVPNGTWMTALDIDVIDINKDGTYTYHGLTERLDDAYSKLAQFHTSVPGVKNLDSASKGKGLYPPRDTFADGRVAMMTNYIYATEYIREMDDDYGIVPIPKYDKDQENYITQIGTSTSTFFIPTTQDDLDLIAKFIECEAYFGYSEVSPVYYETALKAKYASDPNMGQMLDIVRENATITFLFVYYSSLSETPRSLFRFNSTPKADLASYFTTTKRVFLNSLDDLLKTYDNLQ
ncbi:MAG: extracellular solute-binding protein [Clostridia bacterium]|nr:extracellular solute-binding protein [Clostridia bacterium]